MFREAQGCGGRSVEEFDASRLFRFEPRVQSSTFVGDGRTDLSLHLERLTGLPTWPRSKYPRKMRLVVLLLAAAGLGDLLLVRTVQLSGTTHHVQGIDFDETRLWVTSVDRAARKGYLQEFSLPGASYAGP